jgi:acylphosphatase/uncharacterized protein YoxC
MVEDVANTLHLNGYVENMKDRRVMVVLEGPKGAILKLVEVMRNADDLIQVEKVTCRFTANTGEFTQFEVKCEDLNKEMFQGFATAARYLSIVRDEVKGVGAEVRKVGVGVDEVSKEVKEVGAEVRKVGVGVDEVSKEVKEVGAEVRKVGVGVDEVSKEVKGVGADVRGVGGNVDRMHEDMNKRFLEMNEKYHVISKVLIDHTDALTELVKDYIETKEKKTA